MQGKLWYGNSLRVWHTRWIQSLRGIRHSSEGRVSKREGCRIMPKTVGNQLWKSFDWALCRTAGITFDTIQFFNKYSPNPSFIPKWSEKPMLKSWEKSKPTLGWPRTTDSLCPPCVHEAREAIMNGTKDV